MYAYIYILFSSVKKKNRPNAIADEDDVALYMGNSP